MGLLPQKRRIFALKVGMSKEVQVCGYVVDAQRYAPGVDPATCGIPRVPVSNQEIVVLTDAQGYFELPLTDPGLIMLSKPADYQLPQNDQGQPQFFYLYRPAGSPPVTELGYPGLDPTGPLPGYLIFPLQPAPARHHFSAIMLGDIQPETSRQVAFFRQLLLPDLQQQEAAFLAPLGDLAWDQLEVHPEVRTVLAAVDKPYYCVLGNHDLNLRSPTPLYARETFLANFGPTYYSFDEGQVHFVVLDSIGYSGWDPATNSKGRTIGYLDERQLRWLANDLALVPADRLIFLLSHIPIFTPTAASNDYRNIVNRAELFRLLTERQHLFAVAAHTHCVEHVDLRSGGWTGAAPFHALIAGAACGAWWHGPVLADGLPLRLGLDGTPNGYFVFHFQGTAFHFDFHAAGDPTALPVAVRRPLAQFPARHLPEQSIVVNLYRAPPDTVVECRLNGRLHQLLRPVVADDPHVVDTLSTHRAHYPEWMMARPTSHLWEGQLPPHLPPGEHHLEIRAREANGRETRVEHRFEVTV